MAAKANLIGLIGGFVFFQFVGQTLSRAIFLRNSGVKLTDVFLVNLYERFFALFWLFIFASLALFFLFGGVTIDFTGGGGYLIKILLLLSIAGGGRFLYVAELSQCQLSI